MKYVLRVVTRTNQDAVDYVLIRTDGDSTEVLDPDVGWMALPPGHQWQPTFTLYGAGLIDTFSVQKFGWGEPTELNL